MDARPQASSKIVTDVADLNRHVGVQLGPSREIGIASPVSLPKPSSIA
jgi:hypothetical protein